MTLTLFRNASQVFYRMSLNMGSSDVYLIIRLLFYVLGKKTRGLLPFASHHIKGTCSQHDLSQMMLTLIVWVRGRLPGFSTISPSSTLFFGIQTLSSAPTQQEEGPGIKLQREEYQYIIIWNSSIRKTCPFIHRERLKLLCQVCSYDRHKPGVSRATQAHSPT